MDLHPLAVLPERKVASVLRRYPCTLRQRISVEYVPVVPGPCLGFDYYSLSAPYDTSADALVEFPCVLPQSERPVGLSDLGSGGCTYSGQQPPHHPFPVRTQSLEHVQGLVELRLDRELHGGASPGCASLPSHVRTSLPSEAPEAGGTCGSWNSSRTSWSCPQSSCL